MSALYAQNVTRMLLRCKTKYLKLGSANIKAACRLEVSMHYVFKILPLTIQMHCFCVAGTS